MITSEDVKKTAELARIELDVKEAHTLTRDLDRILDYIAKLKEVNVDGVEEFAPVRRVNEFRADIASACDDSVEIIRASPRVEHGFIAVKKVIEK